MNDLEHLANLDSIQAEINRLSMAAFQQLLDKLAQGQDPRSAIAEIQAGFVGEYETALTQAFNQILVTSIGTADLKNLSIGGIKLSDRLYQHSREVAATTLTLINNHAQGFHDAKKLALQLYEGYNFRKTEPLNVRAPLPKYLRAAFGDDDAFKALWRNDYVSSTLNALLNNGFTGPDLARVYARIKADQLKTPALKAAYLQALDAIEQGRGQTVLHNALKTAFYERNRYLANRIAQTELHRAYTDQRADEIMADDGFDYVQIRMSQTHPKTDICDLHSKLDKYGLGPGVYPKAQAPKPPFHPFCRCVAVPRAWVDASATLSTGGNPRLRPNAEKAFLDSLPTDEARQVIGSREKLLQMRAGKPFDDVVNAGVDPMYRLKRLGAFGQEAKPAMISSMEPTAYDIAKQRDGSHHGWYLQQLKLSDDQLLKGVQSFEKQIAKHKQWIENPLLKVPDFYKLHPDKQKHLVEYKWPQDIKRQQDQASILKAIIQERQNDQSR